MRTTLAIIGAAVLAATAAGCGSPSERAEEGGDKEGLTTITVGATPVPHADVLKYVQENLAADAGLDIKVEEFTDYNQPNAALTEGSLDANYFQTRPFLDDFLANNSDADLVYLDDVHLEAFGLYSQDLEDVADIEDGAKIGVPSDAANMGRALKLLEKEGLLELASDAGDNASESDIEDNPKDLEIVPTEAAQLPRSLQDLDAAAVNGNYAIEADLATEANALAWESTEDNPYGNGLVVRGEDAEDEAVATLNELLHGDEVKEYMEQQWKGVVIPLGGEGK
ncbi:MetQ/NlpA family ABC transporter substrate-binding protein [Nocardiopsis composta]|uniref:Lipoprotein n=1 Tax=Nocardiopsis composta TaxID=157465 RepID=A0A7W8VD89_9ACTN|nr:MetQ/NlpA family ABC transporter substrate-binding protein [Nocardiopsis composta]MBB5431997.1 D-methionine transport system substrate-binding protein [Nocardiopsis composta]